LKFYFVGPFYPLRGGIAQYIGVLGQKLQSAGHDVKILSFIKQFPEFLFPGQTQIEESRDYIELPSDACFIPWNPITWCRTFLKIKREKPDAVVYKFWMPFFAPGFGFVGMLTRWFTHAKTLYIIDNVKPHEKRPGDKLLTRWAFRWVDGFIVQSEIVKRDLEDWYPEAKRKPVFYVSHPVYDCYGGTEYSKEEARTALSLSADALVLLFFGLVRAYKGLDLLLNAFPKILDRLDRDVQLVVAGEFYDSESSYRELIDELEIGDKVKIINQYIPNEDVEKYFKAADLLVLPYRSATQSGVTQVASYFKLPVLSTKVGGLPEVIKNGKNGLLVEPNDPEAIAEGIVKFFCTDINTEILDALELRQEDDSWKKMIEALESMTVED